MKNWTVILILVGLVIPFQNCSKVTPFSDSAGTNATQSTNATSAISTTSDLKPAQVNSIEMPISAMAKATNGASDPTHIHILLYPKTGLVDAILANGQVDSTVQYCLTSSQIALLEGLLSASQICGAQNTTSAGNDLCTASYKSPYAKLNFADQTVNLGERISGCQIGTDLCGASSKNLQNFLMNVLVNLPSLKCEFQAL